MMFDPLPTNRTAVAGADGNGLRSVFKYQFAKPYVLLSEPGVRAIWIHFSDTIDRSFHLPLRRNRYPKRAMSYELMNMPPPQCPPPLTDCTLWPSRSTHEFS